MTKGNRYHSPDRCARCRSVRLIGNAGLTFLVKLAFGLLDESSIRPTATSRCARGARALGSSDLPRRYFFESGLLIELGIQRARRQGRADGRGYADEYSSLSIGRT
jgi:hypothetical protein